MVMLAKGGSRSSFIEGQPFPFLLHSPPFSPLPSNFTFPSPPLFPFPPVPFPPLLPSPLPVLRSRLPEIQLGSLGCAVISPSGIRAGRGHGRKSIFSIFREQETCLAATISAFCAVVLSFCIAFFVFLAAKSLCAAVLLLVFCSASIVII